MKCYLVITALLFSTTLLAQKDSFPGSWLGEWKGELQWFKTGQQEPQTVTMKLRIGLGDSASNYTWDIKYGAKEEDNRAYLLKLKDPIKAHWVIDELNGIVLDQYWVGNRFCGAFTVAGNTIVNNYWMEKGKLMVEFFSIGAKPVSTTGKGTAEIPTVDSYRVGSYQRAVLTRQQ